MLLISWGTHCSSRWVPVLPEESSTGVLVLVVREIRAPPPAVAETPSVAVAVTTAASFPGEDPETWGLDALPQDPQPGSENSHSGHSFERDQFLLPLLSCLLRAPCVHS